jgi:hypothetical protein
MSRETDTELAINDNNLKLILRGINGQNIDYNIDNKKIITTAEMRADVVILT